MDNAPTSASIPPAELPASQPAKAGVRRFARPILYLLGVTLIIAAVMAARRADGPALWPLLRDASPWQLVVLLVFPFGNWILTSWLFHTLTGHFGRVGKGEMAALIGASWLLNYLPLQPGLLGRIAYHRAVHGIGVRQSLVVVGLSMGCTVMAAALVVSATVAAQRAGMVDRLAYIIVACGGALLAGGGVLRLMRPAGVMGRLVLALGLRYADMALAAVRYTVLFGLLGAPIGGRDGTLIAAISLVATLAPVPMGLREWAVELLTRGAAIAPAATGLQVDLLGRGGEVAAALVVGLISAVWLYRRQRRQGVIAAYNVG